MSENKFIEIKTERLLLRKLSAADWEMISYLRSDKDVNKFVKRPAAETKEKALEFIAKIKAGYEAQTMLYWVITEQKSTQMIGSICLWNFSEDRKVGEVGYDLSPKFQGKGIMDESLKSILEFGFKNLHLDLITAYTQKNNKASKKMLERNRFNEKEEHSEAIAVYELIKPKDI